MNTLPSYPPLLGTGLALRGQASARDAPPAAGWFDAGAGGGIGPLHVGSNAQPRSIDAIEQDFRLVLLEPDRR